VAKIIPKRVLDEIRFRNDIADVVGSYFALKRAGSGFKAVCPFHKEKTPSFHVNPQRQIYHCFGCGAGGDVFSFIMQYEGVDFTTAAKLLAQRAGVPLELEEGGEPAGRKDVLYRIHEEVAQFYRRCLLQLKSAAGARAYLQKRKLTEAIGEEFMIGFAPDRWDAVLKWGEKHKFDPAALERCGLVVRKETAARSRQGYDRFRNRIMFPIRDEQGRVIGFSGRALGGDDQTAKYVNSPETPLFKKSRVLYALQTARRHIVETREAVICEGQIDVIRCHASGLQTAVAAQGTAFTEDHARILRRYADSVVIVFDPDRAGEDAAVRAGTTFLDAGLAVRIATLPPGEDPDSFLLKHGVDAFRELLGKAEPVIRYQVRVLSSREDVRSEVGLLRVARAALETITHSPNAVQRARLVQTAAELLNLPVAALQDDLRQMRRRRYRGGAAPPENATPGSDRRDAAHPPHEVSLCEHMVHIAEHAELGPLVEKYLPLEMISDPVCRDIVRAALDSAVSGRGIQDIVRDYADPSEELQRLAAEVQAAPNRLSEDVTHVDAARDLILRIWRGRFQTERRALRDAAPEEQRQRAAEITYHLNRLKNWEDGAPVIEFELGGA